MANRLLFDKFRDPSLSRAYRTFHSDYLDAAVQNVTWLTSATSPLYVLRWHSTVVRYNTAVSPPQPYAVAASTIATQASAGGGSSSSSSSSKRPNKASQASSSSSADIEHYVALGANLVDSASYMQSNYVDGGLHAFDTKRTPRLFIWSQLNLSDIQRLVTACDISKVATGDVYLATEQRFYANDRTPLHDLVNFSTPEDHVAVLREHKQALRQLADEYAQTPPDATALRAQLRRRRIVMMAKKRYLMRNIRRSYHQRPYSSVASVNCYTGDGPAAAADDDDDDDDVAAPNTKDPAHDTSDIDSTKSDEDEEEEDDDDDSTNSSESSDSSDDDDDDADDDDADDEGNTRKAKRRKLALDAKQRRREHRARVIAEARARKAAVVEERRLAREKKRTAAARLWDACDDAVDLALLQATEPNELDDADTEAADWAIAARAGEEWPRLDATTPPPYEAPTWYMYAIPCRSFIDTYWLHYRLVQQRLQCATQLLHTWSLEMAVLLEAYVARRARSHIAPADAYTSIYATHLTADFDVVPMPTNKIPLFDTLSFDFETVSPDSNRIPFGGDVSDVLFSASFTHVDGTAGVQHQETMFNLPLQGMDDAVRRDLVTELCSDDPTTTEETQSHFGVLPGLTFRRTVIVVNNERDLLRHVIARLTQRSARLTILLGYNSAGYDLKFLTLRAALYNLPLAVYGDSDQLTVGTNTIHVDVLRTMLHFFNELNQYSLKAVTKTLLKRTKEDVNARLIRFIYRDILQRQRIEPKGYLFRNARSQTVPITLAYLGRYNDVDAVLVHELWYRLGLNGFLSNLSATYTIPLVTISPAKPLQYLVTKFQLDALRHNTVMVARTGDTIGVATANILVTSNSTRLAHGTLDKYCGGYNYRRGYEYYDQVCMLDMQAYYPEMIARFNLSHETVSIVSHDVFAACNLYVDTQPLQESFNMFHFSNHKYADDADNLLGAQNFVNSFALNAPPPTVESLAQVGRAHAECGYDNRIVLINKRRRGILSRIMEDRNRLREQTKSARNKMAEARSMVATQLEAVRQMTRPPVGLRADEFRDLCDVNNGVPSLDEDRLVQVRIVVPTQKLQRMNANQLEVYLELVASEQVLLNGQYRNMKVVNSSVYGLTGSKSGLFSGLHLASTTTMLGRKYIIESARQGALAGYDLVLSDTDSIFLHDSTGTADDVRTVTARMRAINPGLMLNYKQYNNVLVIAKKTYLANVKDKFMSRGMNKNGPLMWGNYMAALYNKYIVLKTALYNTDQIRDELENIYRETYRAVAENRSIVLCTNNVKRYEEYKSKTPIWRLMDRLRTSHPSYVCGRKMAIFNMMDAGGASFSNTVLGIDFELPTTPLSQINVYKFYGKMQKIFFNILMSAMRFTYRRLGITKLLDFKQYTTISKNAFKRVHDEVVASETVQAGRS